MTAHDAGLSGAQDPGGPDQGHAQGRVPGHPHGQRQAVVITDARDPASKELNSRIKRYALTMGFRTACFVAMVFVHGWLRWVLFACAVLLPYVAVIVANQANRRGQSGAVLGAVPPAPDGTPRLTTGHDEGADSDPVTVIEPADATTDEPTATAERGPEQAGPRTRADRAA